MQDNQGNTKDLYQTDDYIAKNPTMHEEDSEWKLGKIYPMVDRFLELHKDPVVNLLDVGGGAGIIHREVAAYIARKGGRKVIKNALDLSPGMLEVQKRSNPDIARAVNTGIAETPFADKEIDLVLMIDIIEHVPMPETGLRELRRIAKYAIFKVPLDENLFYRTQNFLEKGKLRKWAIENLGHINAYSYGSLKRSIEKEAGPVVMHGFTNMFEYSLRPEHFEKNKGTRWGRFENQVNRLASLLFKISPRLTSLLFNDFAMVFVRCR